MVFTLQVIGYLKKKNHEFKLKAAWELSKFRWSWIHLNQENKSVKKRKQNEFSGVQYPCRAL